MTDLPFRAFSQTPQGCRALGVKHRVVEHDGVQVGIQVTRARTALGYQRWRIPRFGRGLPQSVIGPMVGELTRVAREQPVFRVHLEAWTEDSAEMEAIGNACRASGFQPVDPRSYPDTVWIDLSPDANDLLMGFSSRVRRAIRAPNKRGYGVHQIRSVSVSRTLQEILDDSFSRTGQTAPRINWDEWITLSQEREGLVRIVGLFQDSDHALNNPVAFATGVRNGNVVEYVHAGSARIPGANFPLLHAPVWSLMSWAKEVGAEWWDFGGISKGPMDSENPLAGIDAFKLQFSENVIHVGEEWVFHPRPTLQTLDRVLHVLFRRDH